MTQQKKFDQIRTTAGAKQYSSRLLIVVTDLFY